MGKKIFFFFKKKRKRKIHQYPNPRGLIFLIKRHKGNFIVAQNTFYCEFGYSKAFTTFIFCFLDNLFCSRMGYLIF